MAPRFFKAGYVSSAGLYTARDASAPDLRPGAVDLPLQLRTDRLNKPSICPSLGLPSLPTAPRCYAYGEETLPTNFWRRASGVLVARGEFESPTVRV